MTKIVPIVIAVPKGRILEELVPVLARVGIEPESAFFDEHSRLLKFATNQSHISLIRVRSFDVATFVAYGAAHLGVVGKDVLMENGSEQLYSPVDLGIGRCRLSVAEPKDLAAQDDIRGWSHVRIATKYPKLTKQYFADRGVQAECIKLNGAMELAPIMGLSRRIVDLVSTGKTLAENGLVEVETIADISSLLVVNRVAYKSLQDTIQPLIDGFRQATDGTYS